MHIVLAAAAEGGFNPLKPELGLPIFVTLAFIIVLFTLAKKVFPQLQSGLADREARIKGELEEAEKTRSEAEKILEDYKSRVANVREEANKIIDEARQTAEQVRKELIGKAEGEARLVVDKAQIQLNGERERALGELQQQLAQWTTDIASRIVGKQLDAQTQKGLVDQFIAELETEGVKK
ncbi:MAG: F0F1 ATP synthase subunit B [Actinomycetota bacterium]|nr:F0F1 ATP synthase subunit B [Actinomycetota bacterium]